ncbi:hypothetical protein SAMN02799624_04546 [Paenibacillus sp. UNC496MF]|uniref:Gp138 family membrane-puncturing spike protein n=1 Tax=Paenibacillus sp. UNC496MF TaxID=1502753 RepID=UPI0008E28E43|nr:Gp138 family membrane-puncturing spike protein [Paenibacillus sp. UNC496MF]SFJ44457.1 hypothetical protein SAMN02799624_04546 [Paenibacillus sp. UNC496MF]
MTMKDVSLNSVLGAFIGRALQQVRVAIPAQVTAFDEAAGLATIKPLVKESDAEPAVIQNVPLLGYKIKGADGTIQSAAVIVEPGDVVLVVCADREIKNVLAGKASRPDTGRRHSLNDAVIVGVFPCSR